MPPMNASPASPTTLPSGDAELERELALARSGGMQLAELLERAGQLGQRGHAEASAELYEQWIANTESPMRHVACFNWGTVLAAMGRHAPAEQAYRQALSLAPEFLQAHLNLGHQLEHLKQADEALKQWRHVLDKTSAGNPAHHELRLHALNNSARLLETLRRFDEALRLMTESLEMKPLQADVIQHFVHLRQKMCAWPIYEPVAGVTHNQLLVGTSPLAMLSATDDPAMHLVAAQRFAYERIQKPPVALLHKTGPRREGRVRIGYLSGDLCLHAVGLLIPELLELHDRERFEVFAFCWSREDGSAQRRRLVAGVDHLVRIDKLDDLTAARLIAGHGIDILVDLQGLTSGARPGILGMRPAPVQVSYLGFPGCAGIPGVDWIIADHFVMPPEQLPYSTERPIYLDRCYQVSDRKREIGPMPVRATYGLPEDAFVFCSFNNNFKFTDGVFDSWMRIVKSVEGSVIWLLADNEWARENMLARAESLGVARDRLYFAPRVGPADYLARFTLADLVLDTFPYNAGTTASDALWMGTPIVTLSGRSYISRMAGSLLTHVGLPELVTETLADYERLAIRLGRQPQRVASYKRYLAEHGRESPLFDVPGFVRDLEQVLERLALESRAA
jgi:predicted O-linked N-acetylglucosamine transferase (SPINDLY family)